MKGLLRSAVLVAVTAVVVSYVDGEAQQPFYRIQCADGALTGFFQTGQMGNEIAIDLSSGARNDYYGQLPAIELTNCDIVQEAMPTPTP